MPKQGTREQRGYGAEHRRLRADIEPIVAEGGVNCWRCGLSILPGERWHLGHLDGTDTYAGPEHVRCNTATNSRSRKLNWRQKLEPVVDEPDGFDSRDEVWNVPWLKGLRRVPRDAVWPRLMTVPHPDAVDSLGPVFCRFAKARSGVALRWWQQLVAARLLEVDARGELVWEALLLTLARQLGKSWLLRELLFWRMHQGDRFGEPQLVVHTGNNLRICVEVQKDLRAYCRDDRAYKVIESNGREEIEYLKDGSRWMLRANSSDSGYGYSASLVAVDEAWEISADRVEEQLVPTMIERKQTQLLLISTAHRRSKSLMLGRRRAALDELETGRGDLMVEWSAPRSMPIDDREGWRLASPHWTAKRERQITQQLARQQVDENEADPEQYFRSQVLNQWPYRVNILKEGVEPLLPPGAWAALRDDSVDSFGADLFLALEDVWGRGAALAVAARLGDGRIELDGWVFDGWDDAIAEARRFRANVAQVVVGASLLERAGVREMDAVPVGSRETREGLPLFRDLCAAGIVTHTGGVLDVEGVLVQEALAGLRLVERTNNHLVKAACWALHAAHKRALAPAVA